MGRRGVGVELNMTTSRRRTCARRKQVCALRCLTCWETATRAKGQPHGKG
ncbi:MAG: hypothetical protein ACLUI3_03170 [Christensenellales bacterium]